MTQPAVAGGCSPADRTWRSATVYRSAQTSGQPTAAWPALAMPTELAILVMADRNASDGATQPPTAGQLCRDLTDLGDRSDRSSPRARQQPTVDRIVQVERPKPQELDVAEPPGYRASCMGGGAWERCRAALALFEAVRIADRGAVAPSMPADPMATGSQHFRSRS
eukprot:scaffold84377_cov75-Phaeocystis_antarctica.AAC.10